MNDDELRELRAYHIGYDLGWFRAMETVEKDLNDIFDCVIHSETMRKIECEVEEKTGERPLFCAKLLNTIMEIKELRKEKEPVLLVERKAISRISDNITKLPPEVFKNEMDIPNGITMLLDGGAK